MALFKKADKEGKRKGLESTIGKIIYGFLLFAPLLAILTTCMYVTFNKNAYQSYYGKTINEENVEKKPLKNNQQYIFDNTRYTPTDIIDKDFGTNENNTYYVNIIEIYTNTTTYNNEDILANVNKICISKTYGNIPNNWFPITLYENTTQVLYYQSNNAILRMLVEITEFTEKPITYQYANCFYEITYNNLSYLSEAFYYSVEKAQQSNLFNWAKDTGTYTVLQNVCNGIGITNTFTPMLMSYWLLISIIYFIYDIALMLILILHKKIHELTESV